MKKAFTFLFVLLICLSCVFASDEGVSTLLGLGNDSFTRGLSRNEDDFKSFGLYADVFYKDWDFYADLDAYTYKSEDFRYDLLTVGAVKDFSFNDLFLVKAGLGLQFKGNLGGQTMQNIIHGFMDITKVYLDYNPSEVYASVRAQIEGQMNMTISPYVYARSGFDAVVKAGARLKTGPSSALYLTYSYDAFKNHGINFGMESDYGFLYSAYEVNFLNKFGYGVVSVNPFKSFTGNGSTVTGTDLMTDYGKYSMFEVRFPVKDQFTAFVNIKYQTGEVDHNVDVRKEDNWYFAGAGCTVLDRVELRAYAGAHYYEQRENGVISTYTNPVGGLGARVRLIDAFNISFNVEGGVLFEKEVIILGGISITI